jgi:Gram-negative bacterial TonB protein C-terminal
MKYVNVTVLLVASVSTALILNSEASPRRQTSADGRYADTTEGFHRFLQDILDATKSGDKQRLALLIKSTEIPNCDVWLHQMYKSDSADSWMGLCDPKILSSKENSMREQFAEFAKEAGDFSTRKLNDHLQGDQGGLEFGLVHGGKQPLEVYFASWQTSNQPPEDRGESIGYFYFLDGGFRWESGITVGSKIKTSTAKFVQPQLIKKVDPVYPTTAVAQHIVGTVRVYYVIGGDGKVYNAHAISGDGLSEDPSLRKAAEDAVLQWKYQPATLDGKAIQIDGVTAYVTFQ